MVETEFESYQNQETYYIAEIIKHYDYQEFKNRSRMSISTHMSSPPHLKFLASPESQQSDLNSGRTQTNFKSERKALELAILRE